MKREEKKLEQNNVENHHGYADIIALFGLLAIALGITLVSIIQALGGR